MTTTSKPIHARFAAADLSDTAKRDRLAVGLREKFGAESYPWVSEVFTAPDYLTYTLSLPYPASDKLYRCDYAIDDELNVTFGEPVEVVAQTVYTPVPVKMAQFSIATPSKTENGHNIYAQSLLFEIDGDAQTFAGQAVGGADFTVTSGDLAELAKTFSRATIGLEHINTMLGDNCGFVDRIWMDETGRKLFGNVGIPTGLDDVIPAEQPRTVSVELFRDKLTGALSMPRVDLVLNPRIEAAMLNACATFAKTGKAPTTPPRQSGKEPIRMKDAPGFVKSLAGLFKQHGIETEPATDETITAEFGQTPAQSAEFARMKTENEQFRAQAETTRKNMAATFAIKLKDAGKIQVTKQAETEKDYLEILESDAKNGTNFAAKFTGLMEAQPPKFKHLLNDTVEDDSDGADMAGKFMIYTSETGAGKKPAVDTPGVYSNRAQAMGQKEKA